MLSKGQVPNKTSPEYARIKEACDINLGVPSQNLLIDKMQKAAWKYWSNVALKVNVKLQRIVNEAGQRQPVQPDDAQSTTVRGGVNHRVANWLPGFDKHDTCVMGAECVAASPFSLTLG